MTVNVNQEPHTTEVATLAELIEELGLPQRGVAAAIANKMIQRNDWAATKLSDGDNILIIKAACGG